MKRNWWSRLAAAIFLSSTVALLAGVEAGAERTTICKPLAKPTIVVKEGDEHLPDSRLLQFWDLDNSRSLWSTTAGSPRAYRRYVAEIRDAGFKTDPIAALRASSSVNNDIVLQAAAMWIRPANCLEKTLMGLQNSRVSITRDPTEFVNIVLGQPGTERVRVYFYSVNRNGIGAMTPLTKLIDADVKQGWQVNFVLHNHAFHLSDPALNGILAPSVPDANFNFNFANSHGLREARITNGVDTVEIPSADFERFQRD